MKIEFIAENGWTRVVFVEQKQIEKATFIENMDALSNRVKTEYLAHPQPLVFDMSTLAYIDSQVVTILVQTIRLAPKEKIGLIATSPAIVDILELLGLDNLIQIFPSRAELEEFFFPDSEIRRVRPM